MRSLNIFLQSLANNSYYPIFVHGILSSDVNVQDAVIPFVTIVKQNVILSKDAMLLEHKEANIKHKWNQIYHLRWGHPRERSAWNQLLLMQPVEP